MRHQAHQSATLDDGQMPNVPPPHDRHRQVDAVIDLES
jgi:hypothetical protein